MLKHQLEKLNVLIADDQKIVQRLVYDVLVKLGFRSITVASSGRQAIDYAAETKFDFIITDWRMGDLDGIDLIRFIRTSPKALNKRVPIILLTGNTEVDDVVEARDAGVNEYVIKPFSAEQLVKRIRAIILKPKSFVEAPEYSGPDRRFRKANPPSGKDRRGKKKTENLWLE